MKELLINYAFDSDKNIVFAKDAVKGVLYTCPECGEELVFKSSGKMGPGSRRPHFAHKCGGGSNCAPESILHSAFKTKTVDIFNEKLKSGCKDFIVNWKCRNCNKSYSGNLLFLAMDVKIEFDLGVCRPDVALLDSNGKIVIAVEIVNTHAPEEAVLKYYRDNGIVLVQYNVTESDLLDVEEKLKYPDDVSLCLDSKCKVYLASNIYRYFEKLKLQLICKRCNSQVNAYVERFCTILGYVEPSYYRIYPVDKCKCIPRLVYTRPQCRSRRL